MPTALVGGCRLSSKAVKQSVQGQCECFNSFTRQAVMPGCITQMRKSSADVVHGTPCRSHLVQGVTNVDSGLGAVLSQLSHTDSALCCVVCSCLHLPAPWGDKR